MVKVIQWEVKVILVDYPLRNIYQIEEGWEPIAAYGRTTGGKLILRRPLKVIEQEDTACWYFG